MEPRLIDAITRFIPHTLWFIGRKISCEGPDASRRGARTRVWNWHLGHDDDGAVPLQAYLTAAAVASSACVAPARRRWRSRSGLFDRTASIRRSRRRRWRDGSPPRSRSIPVPAGDADTA